MRNDTLKIGELAEMCAITIMNLRYYEGLGVIGLLRRHGKFRVDASEMKQIKELQDLVGWSLDEIRLQ